MHGGYFRRETAPSPGGRPAATESDATVAYLAPFAAITATAMLTGAFSAGFDWLYPLRVVVAIAVLWCFRRTYTSLTWTLSWQAVAIGIATSVAWIALTPADPAQQAGWPRALAAVPAQWAALWVAIRLVGYVVTVPIAEELAFRGFLPRRMRSADFDRLPVTFTWPTFLISSALFGAFHGKFWLGGVIAGMAFALALYRRGRIVDAVQAHATTNGVLALYAFTTGHWSVWG
jgi:CAAX prenyl protease-like protein